MIAKKFKFLLVAIAFVSNAFGLEVRVKQIEDCLEFTFVNDEKNPICISDIEKTGTSLMIVHDGGRGGVLFQPKNRSPYLKHLVVLMPKDEESSPQEWSCKFVVQSKEFRGRGLKDEVKLMIWKATISEAGRNAKIALADLKYVEVNATFGKSTGPVPADKQ